MQYTSVTLSVSVFVATLLDLECASRQQKTDKL